MLIAARVGGGQRLSWFAFTMIGWSGRLVLRESESIGRNMHLVFNNNSECFGVVSQEVRLFCYALLLYFAWTSLLGTVHIGLFVCCAKTLLSGIVCVYVLVCVECVVLGEWWFEYCVVLRLSVKF